jgi:hypothetical protein
LHKGGVQADTSTSEAKALSILKELVKNKPITPKTRDKLMELGIDPFSINTREEAKEAIYRAEIAARAKAEAKQNTSRILKQRQDDQPQIIEQLDRLSVLANQVSEFDPEWKPKSLSDLYDLTDYVGQVEDAIKAANYDEQSITYSEFWDKAGDIRLASFPSGVDPELLRQFRAKVFRASLKNPDSFDVIRILKQSFSDVEID